MLKTHKSPTVMSQQFGKIMGINAASTRLDEVLASVENLISDSDKFYIVTPNPELILMAQKNKDLRNALNCANLSIPDGIGLKFVNPKLNIIKGRKLFLELIKLAGKKGWKVFLLGGMGSEAELTAKKIKVLDPRLRIRFFSGPKLNKNAEPASEIDRKLQIEAFDQINDFNPELLFVAFNNPKQEIWIHKNLSRLDIGGAMAVGGTFRYIAGFSKLPPKWIEETGFEWLWRLVMEPSRVGRIFRATVVFPLRAIMYKD